MVDPPRTGPPWAGRRPLLVACILLVLAGLILFVMVRPDPWPDRIYEEQPLLMFSNPPVLPYWTAPTFESERVEGEWAGEVKVLDSRGRRVTRVTLHGESTDLMWWERFRDAVKWRRSTAVYEERPDEAVGEWRAFDRVE